VALVIGACLFLGSCGSGDGLSSSSTLAMASTTADTVPALDLSVFPEQFWAEVGPQLGTDWPDLEQGEIAEDVQAMCEMLATEPSQFGTMKDFGFQLAAERYEVHATLPPELDAGEYFAVIMLGTNFFCPQQYAYADSLALESNPGAGLTDQELEEWILGMWPGMNEGSRWNELPNEAFSVADVRRISDDFCAEVGQNGAQAADEAITREVLGRIPSATADEMTSASFSMASFAIVALCPEHKEAFYEYLGLADSG
jgi:hypothetical protein